MKIAKATKAGFEQGYITERALHTIKYDSPETFQTGGKYPIVCSKNVLFLASSSSLMGMP